MYVNDVKVVVICFDALSQYQTGERSGTQLTIAKYY